MKSVIFIFFSLVYHVAECQSLLEVKQKPLKLLNDSICKSIDLKSDYSIRKDTIPVYDTKEIDKIIFYHIEILYFYENKLVKAQIQTENQYSFTYYFQNSNLIKTVLLDTNKLQTEYYYSKDDNAITKSLAERLSMVYPEFTDYYEKLIIGRTFIETSFKK